MICTIANVFSSDNLNGAQILGRVIRVDHVTKYKKKEEEDEENCKTVRSLAAMLGDFDSAEFNSPNKACEEESARAMS